MMKKIIASVLIIGNVCIPSLVVAQSTTSSYFSPGQNIGSGSSFQSMNFSGVGGALAGCLNVGWSIVSGVSNIFSNLASGSSNSSTIRNTSIPNITPTSATDQINSMGVTGRTSPNVTQFEATSNTAAGISTTGANTVPVKETEDFDIAGSDDIIDTDTDDVDLAEEDDEFEDEEDEDNREQLGFGGTEEDKYFYGDYEPR